MTKKLLHTTTRNYLILSAVILLVSAPLFYFTSHALYIYEADEVLMYHRDDFVKHHQNTFKASDIAVWNKYNRSSNIIPYTNIKTDSLFSATYYDSIAGEEEPFRILWAPITIDKKKYTYTEQSNLVEMEGMVISIAVMFLLVIAFLMVGIIWLSKRSAEQLWKPFYNTLSQIQHFEIDKNQQPQFTDTAIEEFAQLNKSLEKLIEKNRAIYKNQREFVENAAHELQTPLALFQTKIDAFSQLNITKEQSLILASLHKDVARLNRLNKNLLLFSKIENDNYLEVETVALNACLEKHFGFFAEQAAAKNIDIVTEFSETLEVTSNPALLDVMINNLFLNAIRHNVTGGRIVITIAQNSISFANTGPEGALDEQRMFNRFAKIDPSGKGNGLGLAIVKKVVEVNHWRIDYHYADPLHIFSVSFKK